MQTILVFIKCDLGQTYEVANRLADIDTPPHTYSISGEYDLFCMFHLPTETEVGRFVAEQVQTVEGIKATKTTITFHAF